MCYYITAAIPVEADIKAIEPIALRHGFKFAPVLNSCVQEQLPSGMRYFRATCHYCDCATVGHLRGASKHAPVQNEIAKLRKKGWSEAKISRWVEEKTRDEEKTDGPPGEASTANEWEALFRDLATSGKLPAIGILIHFYSGAIEQEIITIKGTLSANATSLSPDFFKNLDDDTLYVVRLSA